MKLVVGLDLGQSMNYSVLAVAEKIVPPQPAPGRFARSPLPASLPPCAYHVRYLQRFTLGTSYPAVVEEVKALSVKLLALGPTILAVDGTGVGAPVVDMFRAAQLPCLVYAVSITGGDAVAQDGMHYRVPKRDLVSTVQVLLQNGALKIAEALPEAPVLGKELLSFQMKIDPKPAHDSYGAWREGAHDDLVLATALACWMGEHHKEVELW